MEALRVEPTESADTGPCDCCGCATRRVWGFVHTSGGPAAAYFVQWAVGRVADHDAHFDIAVGRWGDGSTAADRSLVTLSYRLTDTGPAFMVVDAIGRPAATSGLAAHVLRRSDVLGRPIAVECFRIADALLAQDARLQAILGPYEVTPPARKPWWRVWKRE